ncbi:MAG: hypothetical protein GX029_01690 [Pseudomonadaceae bacterium]|nr:hypothetical protein [Pseudomonadaceae bacterium]
MKSPSRALGAAVVTAFVPVLSLISSAIVALVWLRMGPAQGIRVLLAAAIPGIYYWITAASPDVLLVVVGAALLAEILRTNQAWSRALLVGALLASLVALTVKWLDDDLQTQIITLLLDQGGLAENYDLSTFDQQQLAIMLGRLFNGVITAVQLLMLIASLVLARWWQAVLYNPGGFQSEFHALRLPLWSSALLPILLVLIASGQTWLLPVVPVLLVPYLIAGIALVHGVFAIKKYNSFWLGLLYVLLFFAQPYMSFLLVLIALADSVMNFRHRLAPPPSPPSLDKDDDGEA